MSEPVWISKEVIMAIHARQLAEHGGADGLRDEGLLESALARPLQLWSYGNPKPDLCALAASYAVGLAKNHPFLDGNKRIAHVTYRLFLKRNGLDLTATMEERYLAMWKLAAGEHDETSFSEWLRTHTVPVADGK
ncbi:MAG: type II toxin-antitoxin system death-on-curing family toxin [Verrucomicrobiae bacterium]|nr:type II toxin-antitoxin system death-on-curing family toxin [Verrucomicrobiae bacterium]